MLVVGLVVGRVGRQLDDAARARTAADAAALAGAAEGRGAAADMAKANHGVLEHFIQQGSVVEVRVRVGEVSAVARAIAEVVRVRPRRRDARVSRCRWDSPTSST
ncbi:MAG: hypothetical protein GWN79_28885, partial [Actinobacteria bacterium]|nr:hypothetical protein [Actinomycetota bacterium]NIS37308.1 hypothetical protein [Actinomycetota bacterium]NIT99207.1 hypothetical protein [Actinomycetota bacterium]NIU22807.1 hypothetical protein [Actinomycetota bacterium]NIU71749.1 hypothetical protein [Actinomycetota bacterium]